MGFDLLELQMAVEDAFGVELRDEEFVETTTAGELHRCLLEKLGPNCDEQAVWEQLRAIVAGVLRVPVEAVHPGAEFIRDLGAG